MRIAASLGRNQTQRQSHGRPSGRDAPAGVVMPELRPDCFDANRTPSIMLTQSTKDQLVDPNQTFATRDRILKGFGLQASDGQMMSAPARITITRFMSMTGKELRVVQHDFDGASAGAGHCFLGSFEASPPVASGQGLAAFFGSAPRPG
jgi:hypothetical protein